MGIRMYHSFWLWSTRLAIATNQQQRSFGIETVDYSRASHYKVACALRHFVVAKPQQVRDVKVGISRRPLSPNTHIQYVRV